LLILLFITFLEEGWGGLLKINKLTNYGLTNSIR